MKLRFVLSLIVLFGLISEAYAGSPCPRRVDRLGDLANCSNHRGGDGGALLGYDNLMYVMNSAPVVPQQVITQPVVWNVNPYSYYPGTLPSTIYFNSGTMPNFWFRYSISTRY